MTASLKITARIISIFAVLASTTSCIVAEAICRGLGHARESFGCKERDVQGKNEEEFGGTGQISTSSSTGSSIAGYTGQGFGLMRIMPEQLSKTVQTNGHFADHIIDESYSGSKLDLILLTYGVPLGGVDFQASFHRDPSTKAQTVLVSRTLSFQLSQQVFFKDYQRPKGERQVFTIADLDQDRPFGLENDNNASTSWQEVLKNREKIWREQVEDIFWRFLSRPPTLDEIEAAKELFLAAMSEKRWPGHGWVALLYALMGSEEFWHM